MVEKTSQYPAVPPDDVKRNLTIAQIDKDQSLRHIGLVGDTYTITVSGDATAGRFSVIDMLIRRVEAHLHTGMISRRLSFCWKARSRRLSAARNQSFEPAIP